MKRHTLITLILTAFVVSIAAFAKPTAIFARDCTDLQPPNTLPDQGDTATMGVTISPDALASPQNFTIVWGEDLVSADKKAFSVPINVTHQTVDITINSPASPQTAWVFKGALASIPANPSSAQCQADIILAGSGGTPGLPKDERTLFSCRDETGVNQDCVDCINADGRWTILGCLPKGQGNFVQVMLNLVTGIAGGISFLIMLKGAFLLMTSQGDPNQIQSGKSSMLKGAAGLLIIVFATVILRILAGDIINIPGFGG